MSSIVIAGISNYLLAIQHELFTHVFSKFIKSQRDYGVLLLDLSLTTFSSPETFTTAHTTRKYIGILYVNQSPIIAA